MTALGVFTQSLEPYYPFNVANKSPPIPEALVPYFKFPIVMLFYWVGFFFPGIMDC